MLNKLIFALIASILQFFARALSITHIAISDLDALSDATVISRAQLIVDP